MGYQRSKSEYCAQKPKCIVDFQTCAVSLLYTVDFLHKGGVNTFLIRSHR